MTDFLNDLGRAIDREQERRASQLDLETVRMRLNDAWPPRRVARPTLRSPWLLAAAAIFCGVATAGTWAVLHRPLTFQIEGAPGRTAGAPGASDDAAWISAPSDHPVAIGFSDGSRVVLAEGGRARVAHLTRSGADLSVERGKAEISVVPRMGERWQVDLGPFAVRVTGTRFAVDWNPETQDLTVTMHEGRVEVSGCSIQTQLVAAPYVLRASCKEQRFEISAGHGEPAAPAVAPSASGNAGVSAFADTSIDAKDGVATDAILSAERRAAIGVEPKAAGGAVVPPANARSDSPVPADATKGASTAKWRALAEEGHYREAIAMADTLGFDAECQRVSAADLVALANAARLAGDARRARMAYGLVRKRFSSEPVAAVAAFDLGKVSFDLALDYPTATEWFRTYLREQPTGPLAREANGRLLESLARSGDAAGARTAALDYLTRYPNGPHADLAKRLSH